MQSRHLATTRVLIRIAMVIFILTVVIGILNGTDLWNPDRNTLLTHVHSGTLGWLSLATVATALLIFESGEDAAVASTRRMGLVLAGTIVLYVAAFWSGTGIQRPIAGSLVFIAMLWTLGWAFGRSGSQRMTTPRLGMLFALVSMVIGAIFGLILGLIIAGRDVPGISGPTADRMSQAHPGSMVIGFLILAGLAIAEWLLRDEQPKLTTAGVVQVLMVFAAGTVLIIGFLADSEPLTALNVPLELVGIIIFVIRMGQELHPKRWSNDRAGPFVPVAVVALVVSFAVLARVVALLIADAELETFLPWILTLDHLTFIGVMTNLLFGVAVATGGGWKGSAAQKTILWGVNLGLIIFAVGLIGEVVALKRIGTPIMGVALLYGIWTFYGSLGAQHRPEVRT